MDEFYRGLRALAETAFPKTCNMCSRTFGSLDEFLAETETPENTSGLQQTRGSQSKPVVGLFRNCPCGSTLVEFCVDRRGRDATSLRRREQFGKLLAMLEADGLDIRVARRELLKIVYGRHSEILEAYRRKHGSAKEPEA